MLYITMDPPTRSAEKWPTSVDVNGKKIHVFIVWIFVEYKYKNIKYKSVCATQNLVFAFKSNQL
jgi:hypothetical protein